MSDETQEPQERAATSVVVSFSDLAEKFGLRPQEDPETGRVFFLWDSMCPMNTDGQPLPAYTVQEASKFFFGRGPDWLRWRYRPAREYPHGYFVLGETILEPKRTATGNRYYTLADIERMAHALAQNNAIDGEQLLVIIQLVLLQARVHRVIDTLPV